MVYAIGPEGSQAASLQDFLTGVEKTGENIMVAVSSHNQAEGAARVEVLRVCLVSGGLFKHEEASKTDVARALMIGLSRGYEDGASPMLDFAFDQESKDMPGSVFQRAYESYGEWRKKQE